MNLIYNKYIKFNSLMNYLIMVPLQKERRLFLKRDIYYNISIVEIIKLLFIYNLNIMNINKSRDL